jgi:hypothetical protein
MMQLPVETPTAAQKAIKQAAILMRNSKQPAINIMYGTK